MACRQRPGHLRRPRLVAESAILRQLGGACTNDREIRFMDGNRIPGQAVLPRPNGAICLLRLGYGFLPIPQ
jgi:hypothetical protein